MPRVVHFELPADDPQRAVGFYEKVFGWTITKWEGPFDYWLVTTGSDDELGINGAITPRMVPEQVTTDTIGVESVDNSLKRLWKREVPSRSQKKAVLGIGYVAYCTDTEGNLFGVIQPDMSAKFWQLARLRERRRSSLRWDASRITAKLPISRVVNAFPSGRQDSTIRHASLKVSTQLCDRHDKARL